MKGRQWGTALTTNDASSQCSIVPRDVRSETWCRLELSFTLTVNKDGDEPWRARRESSAGHRGYVLFCKLLLVAANQPIYPNGTPMPYQPLRLK